MRQHWCCVELYWPDMTWYKHDTTYTGRPAHQRCNMNWKQTKLTLLSLSLSLPQPEVQSYLPRILSLYSHILDESLFVTEQSTNGDAYDEDDQDLVSQLQYCVCDMLHVFFQDMSEMKMLSNSELVARGIPPEETHPFKQVRLLQLFKEDEDCCNILKEMIQVLLANTRKPLFFNDDAALRNSEVFLLKEMVSHTELFKAILASSSSESSSSSSVDVAEKVDDKKVVDNLPPLTASNLVLTLLSSLILAKEDGQRERKENYTICIAAIATSIQSASSEFQNEIKSTLHADTHKKLLSDLKKDVETWKMIQQAGWATK